MRALLGDLDMTGWRLEPAGFWCVAQPPEHQHREHGWKLHVSATPVSAAEVLRRSAEVLLRHGCSFKFAAQLAGIVHLTSAGCDRGSSGKFITVYPADDELLIQLAKELDEATAGLAGPVILSDLAYHPGSLVHLRYGSFCAPTVLGDLGLYESLLTGPDGSAVRDTRNAWFDPPPWAELPRSWPPVPDADAARGGPVQLAGRFLVDQAIRHSNRGGRYVGTDEQTGRRVVLKEARPHTCSDTDGRDATDLLQHEYEMLRLLAPLEIAVQPVAHFSYEGHSFLAEDLVPGQSLRDLADDRVREDTCSPGFVVSTIELAIGVTELVARAHAAGVVLQDLTPGNIMVTPENQLVLIDLECAQSAGSPWRRGVTRGYIAPERFSETDSVAVPTKAADLYSLGAALLCLACGLEPVLPNDTEPARPPATLMSHYLRVAAGHNLAVLRMLPLIEGLTATDPGSRWSLARAATFLRDLLARLKAGDTPVPRPSAAGRAAAADSWPEIAERVLRDGLGYLMESAAPDARFLWKPPAENEENDPCQVAVGAAGGLAVLARAARSGDQRLSDGVRLAAEWICSRLDREPRVLPGLYFGRAGTAWALHDAGRMLADEDITSRAARFAARIPVTWPDPELCHGIAGAALMNLHLLQTTGDPIYAERAQACGKSVLASLRSLPPRLYWPLGPGQPAELAALGGYGFAHGVAGVSAVLLALGQSLDEPGYLEIARAGGLALCEVAELRDGSAWWAAGLNPQDGPGYGFWCHGSTGIGSFLIRLWAATREQRFLDLAQCAAAAALRDRWRLGPSTCHGLAGGGEFLLDMAAATGDAGYRSAAGDLFSAIACRAAVRDGRLLIPDETFIEFPAAYLTGLGGVLMFTHRLLYGGHRAWLADDLPELPPSR